MKSRSNVVVVVAFLFSCSAFAQEAVPETPAPVVEPPVVEAPVEAAPVEPTPIAEVSVVEAPAFVVEPAPVVAPEPLPVNDHGRAARMYGAGGAGIVTLLLTAGAGAMAAVQAGDPATPILPVAGFDDERATGRYVELSVYGAVMTALATLVYVDAMMSGPPGGT
ncbi:MAG: hypothetical protein Q8O67_26105 [Deltaproteobacteria bacterium]|nr:hypothetical protein [Deltaproteobacteria bacterium]